MFINSQITSYYIYDRLVAGTISVDIVNKLQRHPSFENASLRKVLRPLEAPSEHQMATNLTFKFVECSRLFKSLCFFLKFVLYVITETLLIN